jgi:hypothetical protein
VKEIVFNTDGQGWWSRVARAVRILDIKLSWVNEDRTFGELRVYFSRLTWDANRDGLIYTDNLWITELNAFLNSQGLTPTDYSEHGMQGSDFVSCDVDERFIKSWDEKFMLVDQS